MYNYKELILLVNILKNRLLKLTQESYFYDRIHQMIYINRKREFISNSKLVFGVKGYQNNDSISKRIEEINYDAMKSTDIIQSDNIEEYVLGKLVEKYREKVKIVYGTQEILLKIYDHKVKDFERIAPSMLEMENK